MAQGYIMLFKTKLRFAEGLKRLFSVIAGLTRNPIVFVKYYRAVLYMV
jgi:hypothetical protein